jgi:multiple sugar transport system permease protein
MKRKAQRWLPVLPLAVILVGLVIFPLVYSLGLSFCNWNLMRGSEPSFAGISNYIRLIQDGRLHNAFLNSGIYVVVAVALETLFGFGLALLLNKPFAGRTALLAFFLVPMSISPIAAALNWGLMLNASYGIVNAVVEVFYPSYNPIDWLTSYPRLSIILTDVWQWTPFVLLICLAGLQALPQEPYEAATLEGASSLQLFLFVTLPLMKPIIAVAVILRSMDAIGRLFEPVYLLTRGGPGIASENLPSYIYEQAFVFWDMSYACAISFVLLVIVGLLISSFVRVTRLEE